MENQINDEAMKEREQIELKIEAFKTKLNELSKEFGVKLVGAMAFENTSGFGTVATDNVNDLEGEGLKRLLDKRG